MKIAMIISTPFPPEEGIGHYTFNLSKKLMKKGHEITVITRGSFKTKIEFFEGIRVIKAPFIPLYPFHIAIHGFFVNRLFKSIENEFDLIHFHTPLPPIISTYLPVITTIHGSMIGNAKGMEINDLKSLSNKILTKYISFSLVSKHIKLSNCITTVSKSVQSELEKYYSLTNILVTGNAVDEKKFFPSSNEENYILYVGRLSHGKGLFELLETAKEVNRNHDITFYIVGKGELEKKLKKKIEKENISNVKLLGSYDHKKLLKIYQNASMFVFLSFYEGFPTVVLEAMSCGLAVLASDIAAHKMFIENGYNGILVKKGNPKDVSKKIGLLLNNLDFKEYLAKNARKTVIEEYTWDKLCNEYERLYLKLI